MVERMKEKNIPKRVLQQYSGRRTKGWVVQRRFLMGMEQALGIFLKLCNVKSKLIHAEGRACHLSCSSTQN
jgi:hypothetical protein